MRSSHLRTHTHTLCIALFTKTGTQSRDFINIYCNFEVCVLLNTQLRRRAKDERRKTNAFSVFMSRVYNVSLLLMLLLLLFKRFPYFV